jgi:phosphatidylglycerol---prolipoprotein diacylglyceryl transferase
MIPSISLGGYGISWFWLIVALDIFACIVILHRLSIRSFGAMSFLNASLIVGLTVFIGFIGVHLFNVLEFSWVDPSDHHHSFAYKFFQSGKTWYGGVFLVILFLVPVYFLIERSSFLRLLDIFSITCCFAYAFGRLACLISGDGCYGKSTALPWGMQFPYGPAPTILPVHPTPLYEFLLNGILFWVLLKKSRHNPPPGRLLLQYLFYSSILRFSIEFIRINPKTVMGLTVAQVCSVILILITSIVYLIWQRRIKTIPYISVH